MVIQSVRTALWDCYQYREVLFNLLSRDLKVKYKRTLLGYFWSLLNPVLQLAVLATVFSHFVGRGMKDYTLYLFSGLLVWTFFQSSLTMASTSLLENENFIKKIYLPKVLFPLSKLFLRAIDFIFSLVALTFIGVLCGFVFKPTVLLLPAALFLIFIFTLGWGLILAVTTVYFRDIQYLLGVFLQLLYFGTPIIYPVSALPSNFQNILKLNPLFSQIEIFQKLIYWGVTPTAQEWVNASLIALVSFFAGVWVLVSREDDLVFRM